jgi:DNA-binding CsgD family transcriptional regulator
LAQTRIPIPRRGLGLGGLLRRANAEIADRLFVAEKTVAHHVSAILRKLGVPNRVQAVTEATRLGIDGQQK